MVRVLEKLLGYVGGRILENSKKMALLDKPFSMEIQTLD